MKKRKDGRYTAQVYLGTQDGKRKYKSVYGTTQKEVNQKILDVKLSLRKGLDIYTKSNTFSDWAERWIELKQKEISVSKVEVYKYNLRHLTNAFGDLPISKIQLNHIQDLLLSLAQCNPNTQKPMKESTLKGVRSVANQVFTFAIQNRVMDYNPVQYAKIPKVEDKLERRALTAQEQDWIFQTPHRAQTPAMIMMYAGLRRGEMIPLKWTDIDLKKKTLQVSRTVELVKDKAQIKLSGKTDASLRTISIPTKLVQYLSKQDRSGEYVTTSVKGELHTGSSFDRMWESYLKDLNIKYGDFSDIGGRTSKFDPKGVPFVIPRITPHWLRHTFATLLYFSGVDILTAKQQLGHKDIKTTLEIYTHLDQRFKEKSMEKLDTYLEDASQMQVKK